MSVVQISYSHMQAKVLVPQTSSGTYEIADRCNDTTSFKSSHLFARCNMTLSTSIVIGSTM